MFALSVVSLLASTERATLPMNVLIPPFFHCLFVTVFKSRKNTRIAETGIEGSRRGGILIAHCSLS
jgi:hypothetical protein